MTPATHFAEREHLICTVSRVIEEEKSYWVGGGGEPLYSILLAQRLHASGVQYMTEDGVIAPQSMMPWDPLMTMVASRAGYRALQWGTMNTAGNFAQLGYVDVGILNTLQVDRYGNINSTVLGAYAGGQGRRFGGPGWRRYDCRSVLAHNPDDRPTKAEVPRTGGLYFITGLSRRTGRARGQRPAPGNRSVAGIHPVGDVRL